MRLPVAVLVRVVINPPIDLMIGLAPLVRGVAAALTVLAAIPPECDVGLLGSIAPPKFVDARVGVSGEQLRSPLAFVGRCDMSRGGLLPRQVAEGVELGYGLVRGAVRWGTVRRG